MPTLVEARRAMGGLYLLLQLDPRGLERFDLTVQGALRSLGAVWCTVPLLFLKGLLVTPDGQAAPALVLTLGYLAAWAAFVLIMMALMDHLERSGRYVGWLAVFNWSTVPEVVLDLGLVVARRSGFLSGPLDAVLLLGLLGLTIAARAIIAGAALRLPPGAALCVVLLELFVFGLAAAVVGMMLEPMAPQVGTPRAA